MNRHLRAARKIHYPGPVKAVLVALCDHANEDNLAWPGMETMVFETGFSERTVQKALEQLEADTRIRVHGRRSGGRGRSVTWEVLIAPAESVPEGNPVPRAAMPEENPVPRAPIEVNPVPRAAFEDETPHGAPGNPVPRAPQASRSEAPPRARAREAERPPAAVAEPPYHPADTESGRRAAEQARIEFEQQLRHSSERSNGG